MKLLLVSDKMSRPYIEIRIYVKGIKIKHDRTYLIITII